MGCPGCSDEKKELLALVEQLRASNTRLATALDVAADALGKVEQHVASAKDLGPALLESQWVQQAADGALSKPALLQAKARVGGAVRRDMWAILRNAR